jgi:hypothetical protein
MCVPSSDKVSCHRIWRRKKFKAGGHVRQCGHCTVPMKESEPMETEGDVAFEDKRIQLLRGLKNVVLLL